MTVRVCLLVLLASCGGGTSASPAPAPARAPAGPSAPVHAPVRAPDPPAADTRAERIELTFMGDVMFGGTFSGRFVPQDVEAHDPLTEVDAFIASDLPLANLETTVASTIPIANMKSNLQFSATPAQVALLPRHGMKTFTIANNHVNDLDGAGVTETARHLEELGITFIGGYVLKPPVVRVETIEVKGWTVAFIAATTKLNRPQKPGGPVLPMVELAHLQAELVPLIKDARANHDLVIVVLHWGVQYADAPLPEQVAAARAFIDAGARAVIGHHPHVLQAIERYKDGLIAYSLGNFVFQNAVKEQRDTGVLRLGFSRDGAGCIDLAAFHPLQMRASPVHHPVPVKGADFTGIAKKLQRLSTSAPFTTRWSVEGDRLVTAAGCPK